MKKNNQKINLRNNSLKELKKSLPLNLCQRILMMKMLNGVIRIRPILIIRIEEEITDLEEIEDIEEVIGEEIEEEIEDIEVETEDIEEETEEEIEKIEGTFKKEMEMKEETTKEEIETTRITITKKKMNNDYFNFRNI